MELSMDFTKILYMLVTSSLIASAIYGFLFFSSKKPLYNTIKNKIIKTLLKILTYIIITVLPIFIIGLSFGIIGVVSLYFLFIINIIGITLLIRRIKKLSKFNKINNNNLDKN
jgi:hypothetical protein